MSNDSTRLRSTTSIVIKKIFSMKALDTCTCLVLDSNIKREEENNNFSL